MFCMFYDVFFLPLFLLSGDRVAFLVDSFTGLIQFAVNRECVPSTFSRLCPGLFVPCCSTSWADVSVESVGKK